MGKIITAAIITGLIGIGLAGCYAQNEEYTFGSTNIQHVHDLQVNGYSDADVTFIDGMAPHHEQAVLMSQMAVSQSSSVNVKELAQSIINNQSSEIATLKSWIAEADPEGLRSGMHMDPMDGMDNQSNVMNGMLTESEMSALSSSTGTEFDKLYLMGMINHHEGAVAMAETVIKSDNSKVAEFAKKVVSGQKAEIGKMKAMLSLM